MTGVTTDTAPSHFHFVPGASFLKAPNAFEWLLRPTVTSDMKIGRQSRNTQKMYTKMNAAPP